jgi:hypothetical protein
MHTALFGIHQKLKGKTMKAKNSEVTRSINGVVFSTEAAKAAVEHKRHTEAAGESLEKFNNAGIAMFEAGEKVGKSRRTCKNAQAFYDGLVAGGIKGNTAANYLTAFRQVVSTGKALKAFNTKSNDAKNGGKTSDSAPADDDAKLVSKVNTLYKAAGFAGFCEAIQRAYDDDLGNVAECIHDWLSQHGVPFKDEAKAK